MTPAAWAADAAPETLSFERDIRPIFRTHCLECHGEQDEHEGNLDLRLRRLAVTGGDSGAAIVLGKREESLLFQRLRDGEMPPRDKQPTSVEIEKIGRWIDQGAPTLRPEPAEVAEGAIITEEDRSFWSFQPVQRVEPPHVRDASRVRSAIDAFVLEKLVLQRLSFSPDADKLTLLRRATVDLTGLPPTRAGFAALW
jgi:hypothetical protein